MSLAYRRRKDPAHVREKLLAAAAAQAAEGGLHGLSLAAVAEAAGVTKGGLLHHFPSREALLGALLERYTADLGAQIAAFLEEEPASAHGRFTRAYLRAVLPPWESEAVPAGLVAAFMGDARLRAGWTAWFAETEAAHGATDGDPALRILRLAGDGLWLASLDRPDDPDAAALRDRMLAMTRTREYPPR